MNIFKHIVGMKRGRPKKNFKESDCIVTFDPIRLYKINEPYQEYVYFTEV